jgi:uncharacterized protein
MQVNILWTGREYYSLENCVLTTNDKGSEITSVIIGQYNQEIYRVEYWIKTNVHWATIFFEVKVQAFDKREIIRYESNGKGKWTKKGKQIDEFNGCIDIDIPLTPFTNTLPINRMKLQINESRDIKVLYLDILAKEIKMVRQKYARLSHDQYKYENVPNDFEAVITVDESGIVVDYPELFVRTAKVQSRYPDDIKKLGDQML